MHRTTDNSPHPIASDTPEAHRRIDALLRGALEPDPATTDRLVASALDQHRRRPPTSRGWRLVTRRWQLAAAAAVAVLVAVTLPNLDFGPPAAPPTPREASAPPGASGSRAPAALRISNEDGPVTVTTPAGSKLVFLPLALK